MDKLIERFYEIEEQIDQHNHSIFLLEDEKMTLLYEVNYMQEQEKEAQDIAWRQMKL